MNAKHLSSAVSSNVNSSDKKEPKKIVRGAATRVSRYASFIVSVFVLIFLYCLVALLNLPYILNLVLGFFRSRSALGLAFHRQSFEEYQFSSTPDTPND